MTGMYSMLNMDCWLEPVCNLLQILEIYQTLHQKSTQDLLRQTFAASACMFTYLDYPCVNHRLTDLL